MARRSAPSAFEISDEPDEDTDFDATLPPLAAPLVASPSLGERGGEQLDDFSSRSTRRERLSARAGASRPSMPAPLAPLLEDRRRLAAAAAAFAVASLIVVVLMGGGQGAPQTGTAARSPEPIAQPEQKKPGKRPGPPVAPAAARRVAARASPVAGGRPQAARPSQPVKVPASPSRQEDDRRERSERERRTHQREREAQRAAETAPVLAAPPPAPSTPVVPAPVAPAAPASPPPPPSSPASEYDQEFGLDG